MTQLSRSRLIVPRTLLFLLATVPAGLSLLAPVRGADVFQTADASTDSLFDKAKAALVKVESGDGFMLAGTGFFIDNQGTVLTSSSVIGDNLTARVTVNGLQLDARILGNDPRSGLAMLRVTTTDSPFLTLGHSTDLKTGNAVLTAGFPLNLAASPSQGEVSGFDVRYQKRFFSTTHIHADVPISPGQVGGPLLNTRGEVVGLVVPSADDGRSIYALPVEAMEKIMGDFAQYGRARHGWVGVTVVEVPDTEHDGRTVRVVEAVPGTPASHSGIRPGDIVLRIDSREVYRPADVLDASFFSHVGGTMTVVVRREEKLLNYTFAVIERPANPMAPISRNTMDTPPTRTILVSHVIAKSQ